MSETTELQAFDAATDDIIFYAFRYCLGRKTYVVSDCADYLVANWPRILPETRALIQREIRNAFKSGRYGMEIDKASWQRVMDMPLDPAQFG